MPTIVTGYPKSGLFTCRTSASPETVRSQPSHDPGSIVPHRYADIRSARRYAWVAVLSLLACLGPVRRLHAESSSATSYKNTTHSQSQGSLNIQVNNDRLTLTVAKAPQIYLSGVIDAAATQRFATMVQTGKIATGSDIYLNASGEDIAAGIALGRLFRNGAMVTHLGAQRLPHHTGVGKPATCTDACAYAYLGGQYRWAPTGADRLGFPTRQPSDPTAVAGYLKDMDIDAAALTSMLAASHESVAWLTADQMISSRLANNGRLPLMATYQLQAGAPYLEFNEVKRGGGHRMTLQCKQGNVTLTAYNTIGATHARQIVARGAHAYFEINHVESMPLQQENASVDGDAVMITRDYPSARLGGLITANTLGAWVRDRSSTLRYGFEFELGGLDRILKKYYQACWEYSPWQVPPKTQ